MDQSEHILDFVPEQPECISHANAPECHVDVPGCDTPELDVYDTPEEFLNLGSMSKALPSDPSFLGSRVSRNTKSKLAHPRLKGYNLKREERMNLTRLKSDQSTDTTVTIGDGVTHSGIRKAIQAYINNYKITDKNVLKIEELPKELIFKKNAKGDIYIQRFFKSKEDLPGNTSHFTFHSDIGMSEKAHYQGELGGNIGDKHKIPLKFEKNGNGKLFMSPKNDKDIDKMYQNEIIHMKSMNEFWDTVYNEPLTGGKKKKTLRKRVRKSIKKRLKRKTIKSTK